MPKKKDPTTQPKPEETVVARDRFAEMNDVLSACVTEVAGRASAFRKNQERVGADRTPAIASALTAAQITAMAREAVNARGSEVSAAAVASVAGQVAADRENNVAREIA